VQICRFAHQTPRVFFCCRLSAEEARVCLLRTSTCTSFPQFAPLPSISKQRTNSARPPLLVASFFMSNCAPTDRMSCLWLWAGVLAFGGRCLACVKCIWLTNERVVSAGQADRPACHLDADHWLAFGLEWDFVAPETRSGKWKARRKEAKKGRQLFLNNWPTGLAKFARICGPKSGPKGGQKWSLEMEVFRREGEK